jgi:hypothetical protein
MEGVRYWIVLSLGVALFARPVGSSVLSGGAGRHRLVLGSVAPRCLPVSEQASFRTPSFAGYLLDAFLFLTLVRVLMVWVRPGRGDEISAPCCQVFGEPAGQKSATDRKPTSTARSRPVHQRGIRTRIACRRH